MQGLGDDKTPIGACVTRSDEQCRLIDAMETISRKMASPQA